MGCGQIKEHKTSGTPIAMQNTTIINPFFNSFSFFNKLQEKTLLVHMTSNDHERIALPRDLVQSTMVKASEKLKKQEAQSYKSALRTVY